MRLLSRAELRAKYRTDWTTTNAEGCWIWQRSTYQGYGRVQARSVAHIPMNAHRLAYILFVGEVPPDTHVHHLCRNQLCCNPDHLAVLTKKGHAQLHGKEQRAMRQRCIRGHDNWYEKPDGKRVCRECDRIRNQRNRKRALSSRPT